MGPFAPAAAATVAASSGEAAAASKELELTADAASASVSASAFDSASASAASSGSSQTISSALLDVLEQARAVTASIPLECSELAKLIAQGAAREASDIQSAIELYLVERAERFRVMLTQWMEEAKVTNDKLAPA